MAAARHVTAGLPLLEVDLGEGVVAGFTTRDGGVSAGPWAGLNLALHVGDRPGDVRENRGILARVVGGPVRFVNQVHGVAVEVVASPAMGNAPGGDVGSGDPSAPGRDAIVTVAGGPPVGVLVADCVPVLLADAGAGVVAAAHAGRRGLLGGVLQAVVAAMVAQGARPAGIRAAIGPAAGACCYEVPESLRAQACLDLPELWSLTRAGTPSLDLPAGCLAVLARLGVTAATTVGACTIDQEQFFSYRRASVTGRFAGVVSFAA